MTVSHTPGPWRIDREHDDYEIAIVGKPVWPATRFGVKGEWDVCKVEADSEDAAANAALIASAPDMAKRLQQALDMLETFDGTEATCTCIRKTLAKALPTSEEAGA